MGKLLGVVGPDVKMGLPLPILCIGRPIELDKPHILLKPLKPVSGDLKSKFPLILKIKYQQFNGNGRPLDSDNLRPL